MNLYDDIYRGEGTDPWNATWLASWPGGGGISSQPPTSVTGTPL